MLSLRFTVTLVIISFCINDSWSKLSCMDKNNKMVDWFIALKYPKSYNFVYLTPGSSKWILSPNNISSPENMVALTLRQSYNSQFFYAYYNDEPVAYQLSSQFSERGHLKGVLNFDKSSGYWLIHSVPKFPSEGAYNYEHGEKVYAQSIICISVEFAALPSIVQQLLMMESTVYSYNIPTDFSSDSSLMANINNFVKNTDQEVAASNIIHLKTQQHFPLIHFGKSGQFGADLYANLIAPSLTASLYVETWIRGEKVPSSCTSSYKVYNVRSVSMPNKNFTESHDHSKWAVSTSVNQPIVCIGDINRMTSQFNRGGGSLCLSNAIIWNTFKTIVASFEQC